MYECSLVNEAITCSRKPLISADQFVNLARLLTYLCVRVSEGDLQTHWALERIHCRVYSFLLDSYKCPFLPSHGTQYPEPYPPSLTWSLSLLGNGGTFFLRWRKSTHKPQSRPLTLLQLQTQPTGNRARLTRTSASACLRSSTPGHSHTGPAAMSESSSYSRRRSSRWALGQCRWIARSVDRGG